MFISQSWSILLTANSAPTEYMPIEDTYSPVLHRISQAIRRRAVRPEEPVAPPAEILIKYSKPPEELIQASKTQLSKLIAAADVKKGKTTIFVCLNYTNRLNSAPQNQRKARQKHSHAPIRFGHRLPTGPRKAAKDRYRECHTRVQANASHGGKHRNHPRSHEANGHHHSLVDYPQSGGQWLWASYRELSSYERRTYCDGGSRIV